jgi:hypothetical protein
MRTAQIFCRQLNRRFGIGLLAKIGRQDDRSRRVLRHPNSVAMHLFYANWRRLICDWLALMQREAFAVRKAHAALLLSQTDCLTRHMEFIDPWHDGGAPI